MIVPRLGLLLILFSSFCIDAITSRDPPLFLWHYEQFFLSDNLLIFPKHQKLRFNCQPGYHGTINEVSKECYNSCLHRDCDREVNGTRKELVTCNGENVGPVTLRPYSPNPNAVIFDRVNEEYYFTSFSETVRGGSMCMQGMKFKMIMLNASNPIFPVTGAHPLLSYPSSHETSHHTRAHHRSTSPIYKHTQLSTHHGSLYSTSKTTPPHVHHPPTFTTSMPTEPSPMVDGKDLSQIIVPFESVIDHDLESLDRLTNMPYSPFVFRGAPIDPARLSQHKFARVETTVEYGEDGEVKHLFEVALPLGYDPNSSSSHLSFIPLATVTLLLAYLL